MAIARALGGWGLMLLLAAASAGGCARGPTRAEQLLARSEPPLLSREVQFHRLLVGVDGQVSSILQRRELLVTQSELALPGGDSGLRAPYDFVLSFAIVSSVDIRPIEYVPGWPLRVGARTLDSAVVITDTRGLCIEGCVFVFASADGDPDPEGAAQFVTLVRAGMRRVDPFGRLDGPRPIGVAAGLRSASPGWMEPPIWLDTAADRQLQTDFERRAFAFARDRLRDAYRACLAGELNGTGAPGGTYQFVPVDDLSLNARAELSIQSVRDSADLAATGVNSLLVSDVYSLQARSVVSASGVHDAVQLSYRVFVDFFDLAPVKDGAYFWHTHTTTHALAALAAPESALLERDVEALCRSVAAEVQRRMNAIRH
jgi:hypothetical protein